MNRTLIRLTGLSALVVLLAGGVAAQSPPPVSFTDMNTAGFDPGGGRVFTHSVLSEVGTPTG